MRLKDGKKTMNKLSILMWIGLVTACQAAETVWLTSLDLTKMTQGYGAARADRSVTNGPITINGKTFDRGVGTHATSRLYVDAKANAEKFLASVGIDDSALKKPGSVVFKVIGDGKTLWKSEVVKPGQPALPVEVDLKGIKTVLLLVTDAGDGIDYDHADWADARFLVNGQAPEAMEFPREERIVLTPKEAPSPRINGARIFGVRPGSPLLFTIPATGWRPMTFSAENLPAGLQLNSESGQITGQLREKGTYTVSLKAANRQGQAQRSLRIVCGDTLALTPHMGWNSWYVWEGRVTDKIMRAAADAMVQSGLINHGYMYVNIDDCWAVNPQAKDPSLGGKPRDDQGRVNSNRRFPDMKALTDYIHAKGLKAGIYTSPGPFTCAGHIGSYQHEEQDAQQFAAWGFDFLKYDWCSYGGIAKDPKLADFKKPYELMGRLLREQPRDLVFNLCQYGMGNVWEWGREVGGHSWRTAGDLGGSFGGIPSAIFRDGFDVYSRNQLHKYGRPGGWNDPDYLLLGYLSNWQGGTALTPLSPNEQYTHVSLWCLVAAPLIFSGDMMRLDDFTLRLLSNDEVIDVDQDPLGKPGRRAYVEEDLEVWSKEMEDGSKAIGLFNRGELESRVTAKWEALGLPSKNHVRDLWRQKDLGVFENSFSAPVPRHGVVLIRVRPAA